jgi:hypothetical protein
VGEVRERGSEDQLIRGRVPQLLVLDDAFQAAGERGLLQLGCANRSDGRAW